MPFNNVQETGNPVVIKDEGVTITSKVASIDFAGGGVTGSAVGNNVTESIAGGAGGTWITENVSGAVNGSNVTFTLSQTPISGSLILRIGRQVQEPTQDYTISGSTITYVTAPSAALSGEPHKATYQY